MSNRISHRLRAIREVKKDERGFTLIEVLVVIIIIGILVAIATPAYLAQRDRAQAAVVESDARQAGQAILACMTENTATDCDSEGDLDPYGFNPSSATTRTWSTPGANEVEVVVGHTGNATVTATFNSNTGLVT